MFDAELVEQALCLGVESRPADLAQRPQGFAAEEYVLGNRQLGDQIQLLVDDADALILGVARAIEPVSLPLIGESAGIGLIDPGQHLHQGGFAGAIFTQQGHDAARIDVETGLIQRLDARELLVDTV